MNNRSPHNTSLCRHDNASVQQTDPVNLHLTKTLNNTNTHVLQPLTAKHEDVLRGCPRHHGAEVEEGHGQRIKVAGVGGEGEYGGNGSWNLGSPQAHPVEATHEVDGPSEEHNQWTDVATNRVHTGQTE